MTIGERIKHLRIEKKLSQKQLAILSGLSEISIRKYEADERRPKLETLRRIASALDSYMGYFLEGYFCDYADEINTDFDNGLLEAQLETGSTNFVLSGHEKMHIEKYRSLDTTGRQHVDTVLDWEMTRIHDVSAAQAHDAFSRIYPYLRKIACAGTGFYFDDIPSDTIEAPYMEGADFIIGVSGDSMEPDYHDGDNLYVKKTDHLALGDVGIFTAGNECYLKELGQDGLISRNPAYKNIPGTEDIRLIGKVIGKVSDD